MLQSRKANNSLKGDRFYWGVEITKLRNKVEQTWYESMLKSLKEGISSSIDSAMKERNAEREEKAKEG